jgi:RHS repeat-associated protein
MFASNNLSFQTKIQPNNQDQSVATNQDYSLSGLSYDANGNIQQLKRNGFTDANGNNAMDNFTYHYASQKPNQLAYIADSNDNTDPLRTNDLKSQSPNNYKYNNIGQLTENTEEGIKYSYNAVGLVSEIQKNNVTLIKVYYNDKGFRVRKESYDTQGNLAGTQYYVRDVAGTVMAIYEGSTQVELPVFGASRLGVYKKGGTIQYELTDHLGNVRAVIDKGNSVVFTDDLEESAGWNSEGAKYGRSAVFSTERSRSGNTSVKLVNETYNQYKYAHSNTWISIDNDAPADYVYSGWFYSTGPRVRFLFFMNEDSETGYFTEISETDVSTQRNQWVYLENRVTVPSNIDKINFRIDTFGGYYDSAGTVWYDDLKIEKMANSTNTPSLFADYYPGGMTMPNRNVQGDYRYAYQGQEKDPETGKEAFEARLYDPRINRWLTTDPARQYHSPYMSMGNNWANKIDPDGRFDTKFGAWLYKTFNGTGGEIFKNDHGQFGIDISDGTIEGGVDMIFGSNWERNLEGTFTLFSDSFTNMGALPHSNEGVITTAWTTFKLNAALSVSKNSLGRKVKPSDYTFFAGASSSSSLTIGEVQTGVKVDVYDGGKLVAKHRLKPVLGSVIKETGTFFNGNTSFKIPEIGSGKVHLSIHGTWVVRTEGGMVVPVEHPIFNPTGTNVYETIFKQ